MWLEKTDNFFVWTPFFQGKQCALDLMRMVPIVGKDRDVMSIVSDQFCSSGESCIGSNRLLYRFSMYLSLFLLHDFLYSCLCEGGIGMIVSAQ